MRRLAVLAAVLLAALLPTVVAAQEAAPTPRQGANGIGDAYFPLDGNGGYDVGHYGLELAYDPATDVLDGVATIDLVTKQALSRFNLDLDGLTVDGITVDGTPATFQRGNGELKITPAHALPNGHRTRVVVTYHGVPRELPAIEGGGGFIPTDDGVLTVGQPHVASYWFPVNDHPRDKARYTFGVTVPTGLEVVANGRLESQTDAGGGQTRWLWQARAPMASYLATVDIGEFGLDQYHAAGGRPGGITYVDAIDPDLFVPTQPRTGEQFAFSQTANESYKRLAHTITVPGGGATMSFWMHRDAETDWDHVVVEAHTVASDDWTTLVDTNGHTTTSTGNSCPFWLGIHPFLTHYQTDNGDGTCDPSGSSGSWNAATGSNAGWEQWSVDLGEFAGSTAEVSISYISDDVVQSPGVLIDDIEVSTGEGTTSFEDDGNELDGWTVPGAPAGSPGNANDWMVADAEEGPAPLGENIQASLDRQPEILTFLSQRFGPYPFPDAGAIIDDLGGVGFALENQTRPVYAPEFFVDPVEGDAVVVHELAHQWFGDRVGLTAWQNIWLNEGFATYAEWIWSGREGNGTPQQIFDFFMGIPANDPLWHVAIGDPGPENLFDDAVYYRGAMTLQALRSEVGVNDFNRILRQWAARPPSRAATTRAFRLLAEQVSGKRLGGFFHEWLHTTHKPRLTESAEAASGPPATHVPLLTEAGRH
jgi:hypothetical protein